MSPSGVSIPTPSFPGSFVKQRRSGLETPGFGLGVATGDADNDGRVDVFVNNLMMQMSQAIKANNEDIGFFLRN